MIQIKEVQLPVLNKTATQLYTQVNSFSTDATTCQTYWRMLDANGGEVLVGNTTMGEEAFSEYGQDNTYVEDFLLKELGLERATEEEILARTSQTEEINGN